MLQSPVAVFVLHVRLGLVLPLVRQLCSRMLPVPSPLDPSQGETMRMSCF